MIDFRYHIVSLISVFLALALGIVVGTTGLNGALLDDLRDQVKGLKNDKEQLRDTAEDLGERLSSNNEFVRAMAPRIVANKLKGKSVLIVTTPGTDGEITNQVTDMVEQAGGTKAGQIDLLDGYLDQRRATELHDYATASIPKGFELEETDDPGKLFGGLLALVLMQKDGGQEPVPNATDRLQALAGIPKLSVMDMKLSDETVLADCAIVVDTEPETGDNPEAQIDMITQLVDELQDRGDAAILAGTVQTTGADGAIHGIRDNGATAGKLSTVDNVDSAVGQVSTVLALRDRVDGEVGQYGVGADADETSPSLGE